MPPHKNFYWNKLVAAWSGRLGEQRFRTRLYGFAALLCLFAALLGAHLRGKFDFILSDARGYYAYLPSVVFDHDLDFSNQIRPDWLHDKGALQLYPRTERGYVKDKYPIGFALTLLSPFLAAQTISRLLLAFTGSPLFLDDGGYAVVYQFLNLVFILGLGLLTMILIDRVLVLHFGIKASLAATAILSFWLGSHYVYYYTVEPFMIHTVSTFWVTLAIWTTVRLYRQLEQGRPDEKTLFCLVLSFSMAVVCRPSNAFLIPLLVVIAIKAWKTGSVARLLKFAHAGLPGLIPIALQIAVWRLMMGVLVKYTYERETFRNWAAPKLLQTLFSPRHGLFAWSPLLIISAAGIIRQIRKRGGWQDPILVSLLASFLILWYLNSAWYGWWFGNAFGGRAFLELACLYSAGLAFALEWVAEGQTQRKKLAALAFLACMAFNYLLIFLYITQRIPRGKSPI